MVSDSRLSAPGLLPALAGAALGYLRWTQFMPMIVAWVGLLLMLGAMLLVSFQDQSFTLLGQVLNWWDAGNPGDGNTLAPAPAPAPDPAAGTAPAAAAPGDGSMHFTDEDLMPYIYRGWMILALLGYLFSLVRTRLWGPTAPRPLRHRLGIAALAAAACSAGFFICYFYGSEPFNGSFGSWVLLFIGLPFIVWLITGYSLGMSAFIARMERMLP